MEGSIIGGPILAAPEPGVLNLEPSLQHHNAAMHHHQQALSHQMQGLAPLSTTQHLNVNHDMEPSLGFDQKCTPKSVLMCGKGKSGGTSDEDEPSFNEDGDCQFGGRGKKASPWHRVKWTDAMVKLLIHIVILVGEDGSNDNSDANKKKPALLQKKGKWKSVSRMMNEKGCYVSPQQCEDKFNDLNKRYKRLNDILGKGVACCVVEDPSLLETMDLPPKSKEDVRKLLSSKQLFYKEICAYHSGCKSLLSAADFETQYPVQTRSQGQGQDYMETVRYRNDMDGDEDDDDDGDDDGEDDDDHDITNHRMDTHKDIQCSFSFNNQDMPAKDMDGSHGSLLNYAKGYTVESSNIERNAEGHDGQTIMKSMGEYQHQVMCARMLQLEEAKVRLLSQALELEKQRFKWERINDKKNMDLEQQKLESKRMKLENERISLQLKQRELEVECKRSEASISSIDLVLERLQAKGPINFNQEQPMG